ncbi:hypothetical protein BDY19DRAFT_661476 [Irpex rosettiformis]|uniref:Uncharacterized protein n=1 Tax=Irpex rosettiformis TaxID=378272 RepID=A0ACB8TN93_9APHY|nr:hypothetical protein BDY19DRAFT_661476 [Irpex rosettiformis]
MILEFTGHILSSASARHNSPCSRVNLEPYLFPLANCLRLTKAFCSSEIFASASNSSMSFSSFSSSSGSFSSLSLARQEFWLSWPKSPVHGSAASATYTCLLKRTLLCVGRRCCRLPTSLGNIRNGLAATRLRHVAKGACGGMTSRNESVVSTDAYVRVIIRGVGGLR